MATSEITTIKLQKKDYNQVLTHIEACLITLNQAYQNLKSLQCFKNYPQIEPSLLDTQSLVQRACQGQAPLKLLLLGGTGVGKSSLINHLAHQKVSSTSHSLRAHTQGFVIYLHERWKAQVEQQVEQQDFSNPFWPKELHPLTHYAYHQINDLNDLWLIDAPDIDSIIDQHPERVRQALQETDLPLWVCSPQNYRDQSNVSFLDLIHQNRSLIAILNQADYLDSVEQDEVLDDAQSFIADLGFQDVQWFMTACNDPNLSKLIVNLPTQAHSHSHSYSRVQSPNSYQLSQLKMHLKQHFDHKEQARLKRLSLAQRLQETYNLLHEALTAVELIKVKKAWYSEQLTKLKPIFRQALTLGIQKDLNQYIQDICFSQNIYCSSDSDSNTFTDSYNSILWSFYLLFFPKPPQLEQNLYEAIMKLKIEEIRLNSSKDLVGLNLKLSSMSLQTLLEQAQNELHLSDEAFKNKVYQLAHTAIRNSLIKSTICLLISFLIMLTLQLSMDLSFISLSLVIIVLVMSFEALHLSNDIQQEYQVFLNQKQVELSQSSHKHINRYLRQDPLFSQAISEAELLFEEGKTISSSTSLLKHPMLKHPSLDHEQPVSLNQQMFEQNQKAMMLMLYKESLQSLQKYTYTLY